MPIIRADSLVKEFRRPKRVPGRFGAVRTLLTRQYTVTRAVDGVGFDIDAGELVGYLGPNGAGKSTTIKMLTGILVPTSGAVEVSGVVPWRDRERNARHIGVVFGQRSGLWWDLPLIDSLHLAATLYDVRPADLRAHLARFTDLLGLDEFLTTPVRQLSLGQRMRGDLAAAMLHRPDVLYLDEPTIGLDVVARDRIRAFVADLNRAAGTTVVLTTHDLDDVEALCRRIILIDHGRVLYDGDVATLKARHAPHRELVVHLAEPGPVEIADAEPVAATDGRVTLRFDPARVSSADLIGRVLARHRVTDLSIVEPDLERVVAGIYADRTA
ncbi:ABC transporter ATP-binding protein [Actinocatenispora rupis]|uniref:ABC transporter ATP-binding protein n=1 Tax=Actinocatenispora rupis TaxID=519421 RepID=A0A8J3NAT2_9ACTN|nr:ATP-binding cassette domain-containing protein [Actinocatenispora rupis]GID09877.1 ABC transporter ATP-binding protein [Actinocatenispora rupis]